MIDELLKVYPPKKIIETLVPFLTKERIEMINRVLVNRIRSVQVAIERPYDIHNGLAVIRTAEALGVSHIHLINAQMKKGQGQRTTKGTIKWVHLHRHPSLIEFHQTRENLLLAGASADGAMGLEDLPLDQTICFLFGNEQAGISEEARAACDLFFHVPMFGMVESYNLSVAAGITLHDYLKRKRAACQRKGDLNNQEMIEEKAWFYIRSLGIEQSHGLLKRYLS